MQIDHSFIVDDPRLPDMKATYSRLIVVEEVYFGQLWGGGACIYSRHLVRKTLGMRLSRLRSLPKHEHLLLILSVV